MVVLGSCINFNCFYLCFMKIPIIWSFLIHTFSLFLSYCNFILPIYGRKLNFKLIKYWTVVRKMSQIAKKFQNLTIETKVMTSSIAI